eukprot:TRINITY_DN15496_c0_g1_i1.p1 TRINITY_DN15496_c0_g1~~TRINITY_DN15496_c0_g1_i1.p1  ORF type:complete len:999 (+),score=162.88 TRINITY_DN15496_c0_g1_i1:115-3111(+)
MLRSYGRGMALELLFLLLVVFPCRIEAYRTIDDRLSGWADRELKPTIRPSPIQIEGLQVDDDEKDEADLDAEFRQQKRIEGLQADDDETDEGLEADDGKIQEGLLEKMTKGSQADGDESDEASKLVPLFDEVPLQLAVPTGVVESENREELEDLDVDPLGYTEIPVSPIIRIKDDEEKKEFSGQANSPCHFAGRDVFNITTRDVEELKVSDPRAGFGSLGLLRGFAATVIRMARHYVMGRKVALEISGVEARTLVEAQFGIVTANVPKRCFQPLLEHLTYVDKDRMFGPLRPPQPEDIFKEMRKRHRGLVAFLNDQLPKACLPPDDNSTTPEEKASELRRAKQAVVELKPLKYQTWMLYERHTVPKLFRISARVMDAMRWSRGNSTLRQSWHFAMTHILTSLQPSLRQQMVNALSTSERRRLKEAFKATISMMSFGSARLGAVQLDAVGNCVSVDKHDVENLFDALGSFTSAQFRVVLFFSERTVRHFAKTVKHVVTDPVFTTKKIWNHLADHWQRIGTGGKLALILRTVLKAATISGVILGIATVGSSAAGAIIAENIILSGLSGSAQQGVVFFLVERLIKAPLQNFVSTQLAAEGLADKRVVWILNKLQNQVILQKATDALQAEVERIMESDRVVKHLDDVAASSVEEADRLREEARRYVTGVVYNSFVEELTADVEEKLESVETKKDPNYGWLHWSDWRLYRKGHDASKLSGYWISYEGPSGREVPWKGEALISKAYRKLFPTMARKLSVMVNTSEGLKRYNTRLTDDVKRYLYVKDVAAYRRSTVDWLLYHDWKEYRGWRGTLKGKKVKIDTDLKGCDPARLNPCLRSMTGREVLVKSQRRSITGAPMLYIDQFWDVGCGYVYPLTSVKSGDGKEPLIMTSCLRVKDPDAFERYRKDAGRRERDKRYNVGNMTVSNNIYEDVVKHMKCKGLGKAAASGNEELERLLGSASAELEIQEQQAALIRDGKLEGVRDEDGKAMLKVLQEADEGLCDEA